MNVENFHLLPMWNMLNVGPCHFIRAEFNTEAVRNIFASRTATLRLRLVKDIDAAKLGGEPGKWETLVADTVEVIADAEALAVDR